MSEIVTFSVEYEVAVPSEVIEELKAAGATDYEATVWLFEHRRDPEKVSILDANVGTSDDLTELGFEQEPVDHG